MSEQEYTPTTEEVRFAAETRTFSESALSDAAFDRWLAAHDAEVARAAKVEALREARDMLAKSSAVTIAGPGGGLERLDAMIEAGEGA